MNANPSILRPIILVDSNRDELHFLHDRLLEAGVENPVVTFPDAELLWDYLEAVCVAADPRLAPCLMLLDGTVAEHPEFGARVREQPLLRNVKVVVLSDHTREMAAATNVSGVDHIVSRYPTAVTLAMLVACACSRGLPPG